MKHFDVFIVRILPFVLFLISISITIIELCGFKTNIEKLHGNSAIYAFSLFLIFISNPKYHCVWNRAMYVFLIAVPLLHYLDSFFCFIPTRKVYLVIVIIYIIITMCATGYLAIRHFCLVNKRNGKKHTIVRNGEKS